MSEVLLYIGNINNFDFSNAAVSSQRKSKTDRLQSDSGKRKSILCEKLLISALNDKGIFFNGPEDLKYGYGAHEKPYLIDYPNVHFNFSHSGDFALCAVSDEEIGVDIEKLKSCDLKLAGRFFSPSEFRHITDVKNPEGKDELFFRYWTLKEAYIKYTGEGLSRILTGFDVEDASLGVYFKELSDIPGYKISLCCGSEIKSVRLIHIYQS